MTSVPRPRPHRRHRPHRVGTLVAVVALAGVGVAACGGDGDRGDIALAVSAAPTTTTPTTTAIASTSTSTTSTTTTTTTVPVPRQTTKPIPPPQDEYGPEDNPPIGHIAIPSIDVDEQLQEGIRLTTLDRGPGHWPGSAMPGEIGNVVVAGHRTSHNAEFYHLDKLVPGDEVVFTTDTGTFAYAVTGTEVVGPEALWITDPTDTPTATLFACHPLGSTAERIVVYLELTA